LYKAGITKERVYAIHQEAFNENLDHKHSSAMLGIYWFRFSLT